MPVVKLTDGTVTERFLSLDTVEAAIAANGGAAADYAIGDHHVGSTRDPITGDIAPPAAPEVSLSELAAPVELSRTDFLEAVDERLGLDPAGPLPADYIAGVIEAAGIDPLIKRRALIRIREAQRWPRHDAENPGMLEAMAAILLDDVDPADIPADLDEMFARKAGLLVD